MGCGCPCTTEYTLTIKRENQFFVVNPPINLVITGNNYQQQFAIENGQVLPIRLPEGQYNLKFSGSIRTEECFLLMNKDTYFRLAWNRFSGKLEAWEISGI